ncbi:MAG: 2-oxoglutarate dehydrogenase, E2 component, dihydrolipoamide succinyltransferase [Ignavibacteriaceae bacterium]
MDVVMPKMGESINEGTIIKWHKKKGDPVKRDEIILEISTDKVDTEIPSPAEGILSEINFKEGDTVAVGVVLAVISGEGENAVKEKIEDKIPVVEQKIIEPNKPQEKVISSEHGELQNIQEESSSNKGELIDIIMPKMGESVMEGTIIKWHKKVGDKIKKDETIFEISTDKVDTEVPSPANGILAEVLIAEQETVDAGTIVAKLSTSDSLKNNKMMNPSKSSGIVIQAKIDNQEKAEPILMHDNFASGKLASGEFTSVENEPSSFLSPLVLNIARQEKVKFEELAKIKGTGLSGRITKNDLLSYIEKRNQQKSEPEQREIKERVVPNTPRENDKSNFNYDSIKPAYNSSEVEIIPMDNIRQRIMQHMINSRDTSVHVSAMLEVDMSKIYHFIQENREKYLKEEGIKLTYMPFIARACVQGLQQFPLVNSTIEGTTIIRKKYVNLGIAVAIEPSGLIVPNIKAANEKNLSGLAKSINDLAQRARSKRLTPDDITNGTFTITNYGVFGTIFGTPIINQPEVAILGVGTVTKKPVVIEVDGSDSIAIKPIMALTLSHDHRLVDGMLGGKFLKFLKDTLENFNGKAF